MNETVFNKSRTTTDRPTDRDTICSRGKDGEWLIVEDLRLTVSGGKPSEASKARKIQAVQAYKYQNYYGYYHDFALIIMIQPYNILSLSSSACTHLL